ncbi:MAG TPA: 50S ribosomal protein L22 [Candidatus Paceibacterota bacterium]
MITASLNNYRQSPRKVRVVATLIKGKKVADALNTLMFLNKRATDPLAKLINSALANAKNLSVPTENLVIKELRVDGGQVLKRRMPRARGTAYTIHKRTSHIQLVLGEKQVKSKTRSTKSEKNDK